MRLTLAIWQRCGRIRPQRFRVAPHDCIKRDQNRRIDVWIGIYSTQIQTGGKPCSARKKTSELGLRTGSERSGGCVDRVLKQVLLAKRCVRIPAGTAANHSRAVSRAYPTQVDAYLAFTR